MNVIRSNDFSKLGSFERIILVIRSRLAAHTSSQHSRTVTDVAKCVLWEMK